MTDVKFPLTFEDDCGGAAVFATPDEVTVNVEFLDDDDPPYRCTDADGNRTRLIVWNLELLLCHRVPSDWSPSQLQFLEVTRGHHRGSYVEVQGERVVRALVATGASLLTAEPRAWGDEVPAAVTRNTSESMDLGRREFHQEWMRARLGKPFP